MSYLLPGASALMSPPRVISNGIFNNVILLNLPLPVYGGDKELGLMLVEALLRDPLDFEGIQELKKKIHLHIMT